MVWFAGLLISSIAGAIVIHRRRRAKLAAENSLRQSLGLPPLSPRQFTATFIDTKQFRKGVNQHM